MVNITFNQIKFKLTDAQQENIIMDLVAFFFYTVKKRQSGSNAINSI